MKTRKVYNTPGHLHELTFSCYHRLPMLNADRTRLWLTEALERGRSQHEVSLLAYVIMPEHVHLLVQPRRAIYDIAAFCKTFKQSVSRRALAWLREYEPQFLHRLVGEQVGARAFSPTPDAIRQRYHFWQPGGGYDRNVTDLSTARAMIDYIHANPVRRGLAARPQDWPWSSARQFAGLDRGPLVMDALIE